MKYLLFVFFMLVSCEKFDNPPDGLIESEVRDDLSELCPTDLTMVFLNSEDVVIEAAKVDVKNTAEKIRIFIPENLEMLTVAFLGNRIHPSIPVNQSFFSRQEKGEYPGKGYLEIFLEDKLVSIDCNGSKPFKLSSDMIDVILQKIKPLDEIELSIEVLNY